MVFWDKLLFSIRVFTQLDVNIIDQDTDDYTDNVAGGHYRLTYLLHPLLLLLLLCPGSPPPLLILPPLSSACALLPLGVRSAKEHFSETDFLYFLCE